MAVQPTSERLISINPEPITKKGIQKQNPQLGRIYEGKHKITPHFCDPTEKTQGSALGAFFIKQHRDPTNTKPHRIWIGKVGELKGIFRSSRYTTNTWTKKELYLDTVLEKVASDLYQELGRNIFKVPKTRLSLQPLQPIADAYTDERDGDRERVKIWIARGIDDTLLIMSRFVDDYTNFEKTKTVDDEDGAEITFMDFIEKYHRPPDKVLSPTGVLIPLHGFVGLLAVARILADTDVVGDSGGNAGFIVETESGSPIARTVKIDPGYAFQFTHTDDGPSMNRVINTQSKRIRHSLDDVKNLQLGNSAVVVKWDALTPSQIDEFLATLFNCRRYSRSKSKEALSFLLYRDNRFKLGDTETLPKGIACDLEGKMHSWIKPQLKIYHDDLTDFRNRYPIQVLKAYYVDDCGELPLPMSEETLPIRELFTQLLITEGDEPELPERGSLEAPPSQRTDHNIDIENLFDQRGAEAFPRKVLITGRAGIGKSTLCRKIAHDWASGRLWANRFNAVYWIPLHLLNTAVSQDGELSQIDDSYLFLARAVSLSLRKKSLAMDDGVLKQIKSNPHKVLVIFDGLDEASEKLSQALDSLLVNPNLHILFTSRPGVSVHLHSHMDRIVENAGFSEEQVKTYAHQFFTRKENTSERQNYAETLIEALASDTNLSTISRIPLQLQMLCSMWEQGARESSFGQSIVRLYQNMVEQLFLWRYQRKSKDPAAFSSSEKKAFFCHLGELGHQGLSAGQLMIPREALEESCRRKNILPEELLDTGLLITAGEGREKQYAFLHLTFQEYLIAYSISRKAMKEQYAFILENRLNPQYRQVMAFLAGMTYQKYQKDPSYGKTQVKNFFEHLFDPSTNVSVGEHIEFTLKCLKECGDYAGPVSGELETLIKNDSSIGGWLNHVGPSPFIFAIREDNVPGMRWLYRMDPTLCSKSDNAGKTPFHEAAESGHTEAMKLLHSWDPTLCCKPDNNGKTPFDRAANGKIKHIETMKLLHSMNPTLCSKPDNDGKTPFRLAAESGHIENMELLHSMNPTLCSEPDNDGATPFHWAAFEGQIEAMKLLHSWDSTLWSKVSDWGETPFHRAASWGQTEAMILLHSWDKTLCSNPGNSGSTPFHEAAWWGRIEAMKLLHSWDSTLCIKVDDWGRTPFHRAAYSGHTEAMKLLHSWDKTLCSKADNNGETPFHKAAMTGHIETMELLLSWDPSLYCKPDKRGKTPFHWAAMRDHIEALEWFLEKEPLFLSRMDKRSKRLLKAHASDRAKEWILRKEPTFFDEGCVIS